MVEVGEDEEEGVDGRSGSVVEAIPSSQQGSSSRHTGYLDSGSRSQQEISQQQGVAVVSTSNVLIEGWLGGRGVVVLLVEVADGV